MGLRCERCCLHYALENDFPTCHWVDDGFPAPCEYEDYVEDENDEEYYAGYFEED